MKVKEIMTREVTCLSPEDDVRNALELLEKMQISGLPVIDAEDRLVGMFTEKEILSAILPSYLEKVGWFVYEDDPKAVRQKIAALHGRKVKEVMRREVVAIDEDTRLGEVARVMLTRQARRIPVLNKENKVVGIVGRGDVLKALFAVYKD